MNPQEAYDLLREAIPRRPELRFTQWPKLVASEKIVEGMHPYKGACYIATQVFCHLVPIAKPYSYYREHFWAVIPAPINIMTDDGQVRVTQRIWDPTYDQFEEEQLAYIHGCGLPTRFKAMSKRSKELLSECLK